jgi:hypothetical protein
MFVAPLSKQCSIAILISNSSLGKPKPLSRLRIQKVTIAARCSGRRHLRFILNFLPGLPFHRNQNDGATPHSIQSNLNIFYQSIIHDVSADVANLEDILKITNEQIEESNEIESPQLSRMETMIEGRVYL